MKTYIKLSDFSLLYVKFGYFDTPDAYAGPIFKKFKVKPKVTHVFSKPESKYDFIVCKVKKWRKIDFIRAMCVLKKRMVALGHTDYEEYCKDVLTKMTDKHKENKLKENKHGN